jgi:large subunit ribosomal protein L5
MFGLKTKYNEEIKAKLQAEHSIANVMMIPKLEKITISVGAGEANKTPN